MWAENVGRPFSGCWVTTGTFGCCGSKAGEAWHMGDHQQNSFYNHHNSEAEDQPERGRMMSHWASGHGI